MVPQSSAVVPGASNAVIIALNKDHWGLVRFDSDSDEDYSTVAGNVELMLKESATVVKRRWNQHHSQGILLYFIVPKRG